MWRHISSLSNSLNLDSPNEFAFAEIVGSILTDLNMRTGDACTMYVRKL